jgi:excisionase family DNA binding protein
MTTTVDRPYTTTEVATLLGVHKKTVRRWLLTGRLRGFKLPGAGQQHWYVTTSEIERLRSGTAMLDDAHDNGIEN